jgi:hypothetical protein
MMDIFVEQIVKKKFGTKDYLVFPATAFGGVILVLLSLLAPAFSLLVLIGVCFAAYYIITSRNLEFEYSVTNGDITIDKIINRRKRKRVISADAHEIEEMGKFRPDLLKNKSGYTHFFTSEYDDGRESWYFCAHSTKKGNILVVFNPEEKVLNAIKPFMPRQVAFSAFGRN